MEGCAKKAKRNLQISLIEEESPCSQTINQTAIHIGLNMEIRLALSKLWPVIGVYVLQVVSHGEY